MLRKKCFLAVVLTIMSIGVMSSCMKEDEYIVSEAKFVTENRNICTTTAENKTITQKKDVSTLTTTTTTEKNENSETTTTNEFDGIDNAIVIDEKVYELVIADATQENIDKYDIVQDAGIFSTENNIDIFGHNYNSFSVIDSIKVKDSIILINDGIPSYYEVRKSEKGKMTETYTDIISCKDGKSLFLDNTEFNDTLRLITCATLNYKQYRWVVIAEKVK